MYNTTLGGGGLDDVLSGCRATDCSNCGRRFFLRSDEPAGSWCSRCEPERLRRRLESYLLGLLRDRERSSDLWGMAWQNRQAATQ